MKKFISQSLFTVALLFANILSGQTLTFDWAVHYDYAQIHAITSDKKGNLYSTGTFNDTVDMNPGAGIHNLISVGATDVYIQKLDPDGKLLWVKQIGGSGFEQGRAIAVDLNENVYITGLFSSTVDFDPGTGTNNYTSHGSNDIFILKLKPNGNFSWAKQMGSKGDDRGYVITTDVDGRVITTGHFSDTTDFDPGIGTSNLISEGFRDVYIQCLDSSGNFLWVKQIGGKNYEIPNSIVTDKNRNVYTLGSFTDTIDINPGAGVKKFISEGLSDIFIQKLNAQGILLWAKQFGGIYHDYGVSLAIDNNEQLYTTGYFNDTVDFDPGIGTTNLISAGSDDVFIQKIDSSGSFLWVKQVGGSGSDRGHSVFTDTEGSLFITGGFSGTVDFDPGTAIENLTSNKGWDAFVQKLDTNGDFLWVKQLGGVGSDLGEEIISDSSGNLYTRVHFQDTIDMDPGVGVKKIFGRGFNNYFILKLGNKKVVGIEENTFSDNIAVYPNPTTGHLSISFKNRQESANVRLLSILGQELMRKNYHNSNRIELEINEPKGIYFIELRDEKGNRETLKVIKE